MLEKSQLVQDSESRFAGEASRSNLARLCGQAFQSLLLEANQELATVLQDYRNMPDSAMGCAPRAQHVSELLTRAVQCAVKQHMLQMELSTQAFTDELTGLYNRRGFLSLAERQLKLSRRAYCEFLLFFIDVDDLKQINDTFDHSAGDLALICTAQVLVKTFRDSDILARLGGDEFAALAIETSGHNEAAIMARLRESLESVSTNESRYLLSLSVGAVRFAPTTANSIAELMHQADRVMYEAKRSRRSFKSANILPCPKGKDVEWHRLPDLRPAQKDYE
ncbi:MAG TPA: GGDEF domain-containing protein [Silvibacterium sp.]|jgi:diguanylate cyclase (GGDEF)-like protein|nr:GGDEF domain-containing protein [Silvibacterium sp.]